MSKRLIIVVTYPGRGAGNDPERLRLAFHQDPTFINVYFPHWVNNLPWPVCALGSDYFV